MNFWVGLFVTETDKFLGTVLGLKMAHLVNLPIKLPLPGVLLQVEQSSPSTEQKFFHCSESGVPKVHSMDFGRFL